MKGKKSNDATVDVQRRLVGTVRFGSRSMPALTTALIPGLASSIVLGILLAGFMPQSVPWMIKALIAAVVLCPISVSLWWVILVDPDTLPGSNLHAEEKIESHWYGRAEQLSYRIVIVLVSAGCLLASLMGADQWALMLVCVLIAMLLILALSYAFVRFTHHE